MSVNAVRQLSAEIPTDDFNALEEKVYRTIELYKAARDAKTAAERSAERLREQLEQREETLEDLRRETVALKREREDVRGRVENMLRQIETMTDYARSLGAKGLAYIKVEKGRTGGLEWKSPIAKFVPPLS